MGVLDSEVAVHRVVRVDPNNLTALGGREVNVNEERAGDSGRLSGPEADRLPEVAALEGAAFDHVAIAVPSIADSAPLFETVVGRRATRPVEVPEQGVAVCFIGPLELVSPLEDGEGSVARFLDQRGPGLHHLAFSVPDVRRAMEGLRSDGRDFTSEAPMLGVGGHRIAFLHPRSTGGVLLELVER